ncbi:MAG: hypothetical protein AB7S70_05155 [Hyphomicrobium sp.]|uniref:hypothetical protein n=1 Tax=Hyphomicrobium sp. TaxID=82 RepID=UPI003D1032F2
MPTPRLAFAASLAALAASALPQTAHADAGCDLYGKRAIGQQQQNVELKCGFTGSSWSPDLKTHIAWCASVAPDQWRSELVKRQQLLDACKAK